MGCRGGGVVGVLLDVLAAGWCICRGGGVVGVLLDVLAAGWSISGAGMLRHVHVPTH